MRLLYNLGISLYYIGIHIVSLFNPKARQWINGRKGWKQRLAEGIDSEAEYIWFHCSSMGEFEQGRPVLESLRRKSPESKILLSFFSPSGYEIRKEYPGADYVCYLPLDTRKNAREFLDTVPVSQAYFVKYEFWYHFLRALKNRNIPVNLISAIFRKRQVFFRWYAGWYRKMLFLFDTLFVQDKESGQLLTEYGITHYRVCGDTRFDRVHEISKNAVQIPVIEAFAGSDNVLIAGSTWPPDDELICKFINESENSWKYIIVPHEIDSSHIIGIQKLITRKTLIYSKLDENELPEASVLIIDTMGLLSSLYQYGKIAYIGGGFGKGIHNTLEAATFGLPVIFGPRYKKFREAEELVTAGAGFSVHDFASFKSILNRFIDEPEMVKVSGEFAKNYVFSKIGATSNILDSTLAG
jgi:3-deoxy-D-manno-octulosonic-acid transferase